LPDLICSKAISSLAGVKWTKLFLGKPRTLILLFDKKPEIFIIISKLPVVLLFILSDIKNCTKHGIDEG